ncbi:kinase-like protein [Melanomma pulvis-pyrius CBS 109.77]|uniref:EKC/KEOPS complex subunit BUD32 n=1 Tax=Melanomma pulvis-pyrius CBS 109.77 TaxID=1314802 RepID=A0A6A6XPS9_9PLEO|nr:kinase-like protein [Melanomma pulvis-pyrius CBS 109.77]
MSSEDLLRDFKTQIKILDARLTKETKYSGQLNIQFIPIADLRTILNRDAVYSLMRCRTAEASDHGDLDKCVEDAETHFLRTIATLISASDKKSLAKLFDCLLKIIPQDSFRILSDDQLPLSLNDAKARFGDEKGRSFHSNQFSFCALEFKEGKDHHLADNVRLPIVHVGEEKGRGAVGIVHPVTIARGHWTDKNGMSNSEHERVFAQKVFNVVAANNDTDNNDKFQGELQKLKELRRSTTTHKNITYHLASLEERGGQRQSLFYELAEQSLDQLLASPAQPKEWGWPKKAAFMRNATDVLHALYWLHDFRPDCAVYHFDISPRNILIFMENGKAVWKLSDFDLSEFKYRKDWFSSNISSAGWNQNDLSSVHCAQAPSSYRSPEVFDGGRVGPESDVWSFACILSLVLSYLHNGGEAVHEFHKTRIRKNPHGGKKVDFFYEQGDTLGQSKGVHPSVTAWFRKLREEQECFHHAEYVSQLTKRLVDKVFGECDKKKRIYAKNLHQILAHELYRYQQAHEKTDGKSEQDEYTPVDDTSISESIMQRVAKNGATDQRNTSTREFSAASSSGISDERSALSSSSVPHTRPTSQSYGIISMDVRSPATPPLTPTQSRETVPRSLPEQASSDSVASLPQESSSSPPIPYQEYPSDSVISRHKSSPCTLFCSDSNLNTLAALLNDSARDLNTTCRGCGLTPLQHAANCSDAEVLRTLIESVPNIDLEQVCGSGRTVLMECCYEKQVESAIILKEKGATLDKAQFKAMKKRVPRRLRDAFQREL